ncbi:hypothetical protein [Fulvimarina sp. MAC3]|uniref:hypothetical protein n=1 Tax=Fulvimarina sp. MAC3 TaxID=3148887 RepID=UPI0031FD5C81
MSHPIELFRARARLYRSYPTGASIKYVREHGLNTIRLAEVAGCFTVMRIQPMGDRFEFSPDAKTVAAIVEAYGLDGETVNDLVAWPLEQPCRALTLLGRSPFLGAGNVFSASTYAFDQPLVCYRTPLTWWGAGCGGVVILDPLNAARILLDAPGKISGEDADHSREIAELVRGLFDPSRFVAPATKRRAA